MNAILENENLEKNKENQSSRKRKNPDKDLEPQRVQTKRATTINRKTWTHLRTASREIEDMSPKNLDEDELQYMFIARTNRDPTNFREAMESDEKLKWLEAIKEEMKSLKENNVWTIIEKPNVDSKGNKINLIDSRWIFTKKINSDGVEIFKARLVLRGFKDKNEYTLMETYAPVSRLAMVRTVIAVINYLNLEVCQMDVKTAFLNGEIEEDIYITIPQGYECDDQFRKRFVCRVDRSIYGLRKSSKKWFDCFSAEIG